MTDLEGILTDGGEFNSKEREKKTKVRRRSKTPTQSVKKANNQRPRLDSISSVVARGPQTAKIDRISPQVKKKQKTKTGERVTGDVFKQRISQQAIIACRQCSKRVNLNEQEAKIIAMLERDFTISNCTKILCRTCKSVFISFWRNYSGAKNPALSKSQKCMAYCQNPKKCRRYPLVDFFIPLFCDWDKIYSLKRGQLHSRMLVSKQIQGEKQKCKNSLALIKVEHSKKKHHIAQLQKTRKILVMKEQQLKIVTVGKYFQTLVQKIFYPNVSFPFVSVRIFYPNPNKQYVVFFPIHRLNFCAL